MAAAESRFCAELKQRGVLIIIWRPAVEDRKISDITAISRLASAQSEVGSHTAEKIKVGHAAMLIYPGKAEEGGGGGEGGAAFRYVSFWPSDPEAGLTATESAYNSYERDCELEERPADAIVPLLVTQPELDAMLASLRSPSPEVQYQLFAIGATCNCASYVRRVLAKAPSVDAHLDKQASRFNPSALPDQVDRIRPQMLLERAVELSNRQYSDHGKGDWVAVLPAAVKSYLSAHSSSPPNYLVHSTGLCIVM